MALTYTWDLTSSFVYLFYITKDYIYKRLQEDKKKANFNKALKRETNHFASQNGFCILQKRKKRKKSCWVFFTQLFKNAIRQPDTNKDSVASGGHRAVVVPFILMPTLGWGATSQPSAALPNRIT